MNEVSITPPLRNIKKQKNRITIWLCDFFYFPLHYVIRNINNMEKKTSPHPEWVKQHRKPGTEIRKFGNNYYVYEVKSFYDKEKKKSRIKPLVFWVPSENR